MSFLRRKSIDGASYRPSKSDICYKRPLVEKVYTSQKVSPFCDLLSILHFLGKAICIKNSYQHQIELNVLLVSEYFIS